MRVARSLEGSISYKQMMFLFNLLNHRVRSLERNNVAPRSGKCTQADSDCDEVLKCVMDRLKIVFFSQPLTDTSHQISKSVRGFRILPGNWGGLLGPQFSLI